MIMGLAEFSAVLVQDALYLSHQPTLICFRLNREGMILINQGKSDLLGMLHSCTIFGF